MSSHSLGGCAHPMKVVLAHRVDFSLVVFQQGQGLNPSMLRRGARKSCDTESKLNASNSLLAAISSVIRPRQLAFADVRAALESRFRW